MLRLLAVLFVCGGRRAMKRKPVRAPRTINPSAIRDPPRATVVAAKLAMTASRNPKCSERCVRKLRPLPDELHRYLLAGASRARDVFIATKILYSSFCPIVKRTVVSVASTWARFNFPIFGYETVHFPPVFLRGKYAGRVGDVMPPERWNHPSCFDLMPSEAPYRT